MTLLKNDVSFAYGLESPTRLYTQEMVCSDLQTLFMQ